jgi:hypothetical protein
MQEAMRKRAVQKEDIIGIPFFRTMAGKSLSMLKPSARGY